MKFCRNLQKNFNPIHCIQQYHSVVCLSFLILSYAVCFNLLTDHLHKKKQKNQKKTGSMYYHWHGLGSPFDSMYLTGAGNYWFFKNKINIVSGYWNPVIFLNNDPLKNSRSYYSVPLVMCSFVWLIFVFFWYSLACVFKFFHSFSFQKPFDSLSVFSQEFSKFFFTRRFYFTIFPFSCFLLLSRFQIQLSIKQGLEVIRDEIAKNKNKKIILSGFSQGGSIILELLKNLAQEFPESTHSLKEVHIINSFEISSMAKRVFGIFSVPLCFFLGIKKIKKNDFYKNCRFYNTASEDDEVLPGGGELNQKDIIQALESLGIKQDQIYYRISGSYHNEIYPFQKREYKIFSQNNNKDKE